MCPSYKRARGKGNSRPVEMRGTVADVCNGTFQTVGGGASLSSKGLDGHAAKRRVTSAMHATDFLSPAFFGAADVHKPSSCHPSLWNGTVPVSFRRTPRAKDEQMAKRLNATFLSGSRPSSQAGSRQGAAMSSSMIDGIGTNSFDGGDAQSESRCQSAMSLSSTSRGRSTPGLSTPAAGGDGRSSGRNSISGRRRKKQRPQSAIVGGSRHAQQRRPGRGSGSGGYTSYRKYQEARRAEERRQDDIQLVRTLC